MKGRTKMAIMLSCIALWLTYKFMYYLYITGVNNNWEHCWQTITLQIIGILVFSILLTLTILIPLQYIFSDEYNTEEIEWYYWLAPTFWIVLLVQWLLHLGDKYLND